MLDYRLRDRLDEVFSNIEEARKEVSLHHIVKIVAVTKYSDSSIVEKLYSIGQRAFGENRVQDLEEKSQILEELPLEWHFIGNLQKNKINKLISLKPSLFQSLDSLELAEQLNSRLQNSNMKMSALLQVNSARESQKSGVEPEKGYDTYMEIRERFPNINLKGIMAMGRHSENESEVRQSFQEAYRVFERVQKDGATICSMGMSGDYKIAISEGSNMVRLGSVLIK
jgi:pyridoxal phosphate enzyme (YggS family)